MLYCCIKCPVNKQKNNIMPKNGSSFRLHVSKTKMNFIIALSNLNQLIDFYEYMKLIPVKIVKNIIYSEWGIIEDIKIDKNLSMILRKFCLILYRRFKI